MEAFSNCCRLCLCRKKGEVDLFQTRSANQITELFRIDLVDFPAWPKMACKECVRILKAVQLWKETIVASQARLAEVAAENVKESDPEDKETHQDVPEEDPDLDDIKEELKGSGSNFSQVTQQSSGNPWKKPIKNGSQDWNYRKRDAEPAVGGRDGLGGAKKQKLDCPRCQRAHRLLQCETFRKEKKESRDALAKEKALCNMEMKLKPDVVVEEAESGSKEAESEEEYKPEPKETRKRKYKSSGIERKKATYRSKEESQVLVDLMRNMGLLNCTLCKEESESYLALLRHQRLVHQLTSPGVYCCGMKFVRSTAMGHMEYHLNPDGHKCEMCENGKFYLSEVKLNRHKLLVHSKPDEVQYSCETCGKGFARPYFLEQHKLQHSPVEDRMFQCPQPNCDHKYNSKAQLTTHIKNVHEKAPDFICEACGKGYPRRKAMEDHFNIHHAKAQSEECKICHKFVFDMVSHLKWHRNEGLIQCEHCEFKTTKNRMKAHVRKHHLGIAVKPLPCLICNREYKTQRGLKEHIDGHNGIRYKCDFCPLESTTSGNKYTHMMQKHPVEYAEAKAKRKAQMYTPKVKSDV